MSQEALSDSHIKGWEILSFDKVKLKSTKLPIVIGKLRVIFFEEFDLCTLYLNEWSFSLFKDLSVLKLFEDPHMPLVYLFQRDDGVDSLTFTEITQLEAIKKFETILNHYARFEQNQEKLLRMDDNFLINFIEDKTIVSFFPRENVMQEIISGKVLVEKLKNQKFAAQEVSLINTITKILQSNLQENQYKKDQVTHNNFINNQEITLLDPIQGSVQTQTNEVNPPSSFFSKIKKTLKFSKKDNSILRDESDPNSDKTIGINVLTFDEVELYRARNDKVTFETIGTLRVVYFPDYFQFILYLNDWTYVLLKELPILKYCTNCSDSNVYYFKSKDAIVSLKFPQVLPVESIQNFDTILEHNSVLLKNEEELEEIKLQDEESEEFILNENRKKIVSMFRVQRIKEEEKQELKGIDKIKRRIIISANKVLRKSPSTKENSNMNNVKDYDSLLKTNEDEASSELEMRKNVEGLISEGKDFVQQLRDSDLMEESRKEKKAMKDIKTSFKGVLDKLNCKSSCSAKDTELMLGEERTIEPSKNIQLISTLDENSNEKVQPLEEKIQETISRELGLKINEISQIEKSLDSFEMLFSVRVDKEGNINVAEKKPEIIPGKKEYQSIVDDQNGHNSSIKLEVTEIKLEKEQKETNDPENVTRTPEGNSVLFQRTNLLETPLENNEPKTKDMSEIYQKQVEERNLEEKNEREVVQDLRGIPEL